MDAARSYTGSCHCGKVRFEATMDLSRVVSCNCSICSRLGYVLSFIPAAQFKLLAGEDALSDYQFNKKRIHHLFCATCGIHPFARGTGPDGKETVAVNLRCLEGVDLEALTPQKFDGKRL
ncbi:MAG: GFA family protein [Sinobacteraceae bacterium]|nr:GFA family protein [Nevskiaceae bacterium]